MLCVVSGQHRYSRKIFNGKTFAVSKNLQKPWKFSPSNDLTYMVYSQIYQMVYHGKENFSPPVDSYFNKLIVYCQVFIDWLVLMYTSDCLQMDWVSLNKQSPSWKSPHNWLMILVISDEFSTSIFKILGWVFQFQMVTLMYVWIHEGLFSTIVLHKNC